MTSKKTGTTRVFKSLSVVLTGAAMSVSEQISPDAGPRDIAKLPGEFAAWFESRGWAPRRQEKGFCRGPAVGLLASPRPCVRRA